MDAERPLSKGYARRDADDADRPLSKAIRGEYAEGHRARHRTRHPAPGTRHQFRYIVPHPEEVRW